MADFEYEGLGLWPHQKDAVAMCLAYYASGSTRGALVQYPTGTGKTGIMATIGSLRARTAPVLIVCPSSALAGQLVREIAGNFWKRIAAPEAWRPETVLQLFPSDVEDVANRISGRTADERCVIVTTVQALQQIHTTAKRYAKLAGIFGSILFDEGHREPAPAWAKAVRGLSAPTVLFSATPFRNDIKLFDVDLDHVAFLSFAAAVDQHLIRGVEIAGDVLPDTPHAFAQAVIAARDQAVLSGWFPPDAKVIVRADDADGVRDLFDAFRAALGARPDGVLAVHNRFKLTGTPGAQLRPDVPADLRDRTERFLIHQFMLIEGIDDPACAMLALFEPFTTERQLVQQVGRLTRHPTPGMSRPPALVLSCMPAEVVRMWEGFCLFDRMCVENGGKPPLRADESVLANLVAALPTVDYVEGRFRTRIDMEDDLAHDLRVPRSALVLKSATNLRWTISSRRCLTIYMTRIG